MQKVARLVRFEGRLLRLKPALLVDDLVLLLELFRVGDDVVEAVASLAIFPRFMDFGIICMS